MQRHDTFLLLIVLPGAHTPLAVNHTISIICPQVIQPLCPYSAIRSASPAVAGAMNWGPRTPPFVPPETRQVFHPPPALWHPPGLCPLARLLFWRKGKPKS